MPTCRTPRGVHSLLQNPGEIAYRPTYRFPCQLAFPVGLARIIALRDPSPGLPNFGHHALRSLMICRKTGLALRPQNTRNAPVPHTLSLMLYVRKSHIHTGGQAYPPPLQRGPAKPASKGRGTGFSVGSSPGEQNSRHYTDSMRPSVPPIDPPYFTHTLYEHPEILVLTQLHGKSLQIFYL
jgi:hypothetical protein